MASPCGKVLFPAVCTDRRHISQGDGERKESLHLPSTGTHGEADLREFNFMSGEMVETQ